MSNLTPLFREILETAANALEAEDSILKGKIRQRRASETEPGGLLRFKNERFYQYILIRQFLEQWPCVAEVGWRDLWIGRGTPNETVIEMKCWMWHSGEGKKLEHFDMDIAKLKNSKSPNCGFMVFSANPEEDIDKNKNWLDGYLFKGGDLPPSAVKSFETISENKTGDKVHFWIALYQIKANS